jgi:peptide/nickel transport system substrate-binding protein
MTIFYKLSTAVSRRLVLAGALLGATGLVFGALQPSHAAGKDTLVVSSGSEAVTLDPHVSFDGQSPMLWRASYETLVKYDGSTLNIIPHLAESFEISEDQLTYTFTLRPGVKFTDGTPFDAAAAKFNIERQAQVEQGISYALGGIESIETPDDLTVVVKIGSVNDGFLSAFAGTYAVYMVSPTAVQEHEQDGDLAQGWLRHNMVGTGPYVLTNYTQAQNGSS